MKSIVTGGGAGIGLAIAKALARAGDDVLIVDLAGDKARDAAKILVAAGLKAEAVEADITDEQALADIVSQAGRVRRLVNNAGIFNVKPFDTLDAEDFRGMYEVNLVAMFKLCQLATRAMGEGSAIVNIASRAMLGAKEYIHYASSKAAVAGFTRSLALELAPKGITVNAVAPGVIETDMLKARPEGDLEALRGMQPGGNLGKPEDIAEAVAFLSSPKARFISGQVLVVDGGRSLGGALGG
ncbi:MULTISPECIES: SDR family NAD(P)-dependent oxidoreductase [unclassified Nitratireductor]|uniref:SDR family NAD(P)-dependent oxidoreductase n=1 Tax=unclassified Nitratireductor TaxID=2641084 RepID=UPI0025E42D98|nr:SDR family NAD(P)-dependent oxidoreductase [Nitratireductor sp.]